MVTVFTGGWWIVMFVMGVWAVLMAAGSVTGALAIGRLVGARMSSPPADLLAMLLGLAIVLIVEIIPFLGGLIGFAVTLFGMGALVMVAYDAMRRQRVVPAAPEIALPDAGTPAAE